MNLISSIPNISLTNHLTELFDYAWKRIKEFVYTKTVNRAFGRIALLSFHDSIVLGNGNKADDKWTIRAQSLNNNDIKDVVNNTMGRQIPINKQHIIVPNQNIAVRNGDNGSFREVGCRLSQLSTQRLIKSINLPSRNRCRFHFHHSSRPMKPFSTSN